MQHFIELILGIYFIELVTQSWLPKQNKYYNLLIKVKFSNLVIDVKTLGGTFLSKAKGGRELITAVSWKNDIYW